MELLTIGIIRHGHDDDYVRDHMGSVTGTLELKEEFLEGLDGLEKYSHAFLISIMHKHLAEKYPLKVKPRLLLRKGYRLEDLPEIGVFATDSPSRPNPLGLTLVGVDEIDGATLHLSGLDLFDGTPVVDIKPFSRSYALSDSSDTSCEHIHK